MRTIFLHHSVCRSTRTAVRNVLSAALAAALLGGLLATPAEAETKLGGHFGIVLPLFTHFDGDTIDITDDFLIGFPTGITVRTSERLAFDLEFVPVVQDEPTSVNLVVHPGVLYNFAPSYTVGVRMAFETDSDAWGFTPLIAKGFPIPGQNATYFIELDFPLRVQDDPFGNSEFSYGLAFHTGIGF